MMYRDAGEDKDWGWLFFPVAFFLLGLVWLFTEAIPRAVG